jgi:predicted DNA-binding transcriptional regulator AlpA
MTRDKQERTGLASSERDACAQTPRRRNRPVAHEAPVSSRTRQAHAHKPPSGAGTLLTIAEVLAELQVARSTFDTWRAIGLAPACIKLPNGQIRVRRSVLDAWLASRTEMTEAI